MDNDAVYTLKEYIDVKKKVLADLDAAGWGFAVAKWCREPWQPLRINGESGGHATKGYNPYEYYAPDLDPDLTEIHYHQYDCGVLVEIMEIAKKHGAYWENVNTAETELTLL